MLKIRFISDKIDKNCSHMLKSLLVSRFREELCEPIKLSSFCSIITSHLELLSGEHSRNIPSHNSCKVSHHSHKIVSSQLREDKWPHDKSPPSDSSQFDTAFLRRLQQSVLTRQPNRSRPPVPSTQVLLSTLFRRRIKIGALWRWSWIVSSCGSSH